MKEKLKVARKLKATYKSNVEFLKHRIKLQKQPNFNPITALKNFN